MILCFQLSMPNVGSRNGKWSGDEKVFVILKTFTRKKDIERAESILLGKSYYYDFGDGWGASISVRQINSSAESCNLRKKSAGFNGYDWMVESILRDGKIFASHQEEKRAKWLEERKAVTA